MIIHIRFTNGSNPYVRFCTDGHDVTKELRRWKRNYNILRKMDCGGILDVTLEEKTPAEISRRSRAERARYQQQKSTAREHAIAWQTEFSQHNYSYEELAEATEYFYKIGKKYGLMTEFRNNGII